MIDGYFATVRRLCSSALGSELNSVECQDRSPSAAAPATSVSSNNCRWCTAESGGYSVSEDGCLIGGELD
jgi:hypothetical protein